MTLEDFQNDLDALADSSQLLDFCRKRVLHGIPFVFSGREDDFYEFRKLIAEKFNISFHEIYITGSGKLGFSPLKETVFDLNSDIDVAIISLELFENFMDEICKFQWDIRKSRIALTTREMKQYHSFLRYAAIGWMRPDLLPLGLQLNGTKGDWDDFFESISYGKSCVGNYDVKAGVFKSYSHLETYIAHGLSDLKNARSAILEE